MKLHVSWIFDFFFPQTDDERVIANCTCESFEMKYTLVHTDEVLSLGSFKDHELRSAVHLNKFHNHAHAQVLLSTLLMCWFKKLPQKDYLLIPIPLSSKRERKRGYNQVTCVAKQASIEFPNINLQERLLIKIRDIAPQTSLSKTKRLLNTKGVYRVAEKCSGLITNKDIILLDDVYTTGATLHEAKSTLMEYNPRSVTCVALLH